MNIQEGKYKVRKFSKEDIENKVLWINDEKNNKYLHYDLPITHEGTIKWFDKICTLTTRLDCVIEYEGIPVGLIGLLGIDKKNRKAEYYICMGEHQYKGKGIAKIASKILLTYAFEELDINKVYLYTEEENFAAQRLFEKLGFEKEGFLKDDLIYNGRKVNRYLYSLRKEDMKNE